MFQNNKKIFRVAFIEEGWQIVLKGCTPLPERKVRRSMKAKEYEQLEELMEDNRSKLESIEQALVHCKAGYAMEVLMEKKNLLEGILKALQEHFSRVK